MPLRTWCAPPETKPTRSKAPLLCSMSNCASSSAGSFDSCILYTSAISRVTINIWERGRDYPQESLSTCSFNAF